jgi:FAD/FMN-containing dehydrogenase
MELTLKLLPLPEAKSTMTAVFADLDQSTLAVKNLLLSGIRPVALEFMDGGTLKAVENYAHLGLDPKAEAMLLVELDGPPEVLNRQSDQVVDILKKAGGSPVEKAANQAEADRLWKARRSISPAMFQIAPSKLNEDIAVPLGNLAEMVRRIKNTREKRELPIVCFGHAGDGNLHVNIMHDASDSDQRARALEAVSDVFADALHLGGTLSGEHGVGLNKLGYAGAEIDHVALDLMHGIKKLFDPAGILNPHKAIPYPEILS